MRCPDCGVVSTPDDNYCECPDTPTCAECGEDMPDEGIRYCWEHIDDFSTLKEYCHQREIEAAAKIGRTDKYIKDLEGVRNDLYKIIAELRGKV